MNTKELIESREGTHGNFVARSETSQKIKEQFNYASKMRPFYMNESLDSIAVKLSRIIHGDSKNMDHWRDIAGYAQLVVDELEAAELMGAIGSSE